MAANITMMCSAKLLADFSLSNLYNPKFQKTHENIKIQ